MMPDTMESLRSTITALTENFDKQKAEIERLQAEIVDTKAFIFNITEPRSEDDLLDTLDEQLELFWQRHQAEVERLQAIVDKLHPRVLKLLGKDRAFIVIGEHEPYYMRAYALIREQELLQGTWNEEDRIAYAAAQLPAEAEGGSDGKALA